MQSYQCILLVLIDPPHGKQDVLPHVVLAVQSGHSLVTNPAQALTVFWSRGLHIGETVCHLMILFVILCEL